MIDYRPITIEEKEQYDAILKKAEERGCEYSFANLFIWGRQRIAFIADGVTVFSQFNRKSVYLFPFGGAQKQILDAIIHDAHTRDIPCRITGLTASDTETLEALYPGRFRFHTDRNSFDYLYDIQDLADLKGRKFQRKRNHLNSFYKQHPTAVTESITEANRQEVWQMAEQWYALRLQEDSTRDFHMERAALQKALKYQKELGMEGLVLRVDGVIAAMTLGSRLSEKTFDVHFEKALERYDGAYAAINRAFAQNIREKYPQIRFLNREDDMGMEGLRKAKLSYNPVFLQEKYWACLLEDGYDY